MGIMAVVAPPQVLEEGDYLEVGEPMEAEER
jgi:hypothetical protein